MSSRNLNKPSTRAGYVSYIPFLSSFILFWINYSRWAEYEESPATTKKLTITSSTEEREEDKYDYLTSVIIEHGSCQKHRGA